MRKVRQGVFETNSSSTHSICIAKNATLTIPKKLYFQFGEFGWECDTLYSMEEKASYLYTGLMAEGRSKDFEEITKFLQNEQVNVTAEPPIFKKYTYDGNDGGEYIENGGYIDHSDDLNEFLNAICEDHFKLKRFLFSDLSFIITGNDNDDEDVEIKVSYPHDEYYKGN